MQHGDPRGCSERVFYSLAGARFGCFFQSLRGCTGSRLAASPGRDHASALGPFLNHSVGKCDYRLHRCLYGNLLILRHQHCLRRCFYCTSVRLFFSSSASICAVPSHAQRARRRPAIPRSSVPLQAIHAFAGRLSAIERRNTRPATPSSIGVAAAQQAARKEAR